MQGPRQKLATNRLFKFLKFINVMPCLCYVHKLCVKRARVNNSSRQSLAEPWWKDWYNRTASGLLVHNHVRWGSLPLGMVLDTAATHGLPPRLSFSTWYAGYWYWLHFPVIALWVLLCFVAFLVCQSVCNILRRLSWTTNAMLNFFNPLCYCLAVSMCPHLVPP